MRTVSMTAILLMAAPAGAFHYTSQFSDHPFGEIIGGGGIYYTGSPRSYGMDCSHCHTGAEVYPNRIRITLTTWRVNGTSLEAYDLFASGYVPGQRYKIEARVDGEHLGKAMADCSYPNPNGTMMKVMCPMTCDGPYSMPLNRDHFTAEVMNEAGIYASHAGTAAGRLRPDSALGNATAEGACRNGSSWCGGGEYSDTPTGTEAGGPSTAMYKNWRLVDPNDTANGPFGRWTCVTDCDAIVSNNWPRQWTDGDGATNPNLATWRFFWTAPATAPAAGNGRIRFYMAAVDGDGYMDQLDDDVALKRVAVCPAGNASCDPNVGAGWGGTEPTTLPWEPLALALLLGTLLLSLTRLPAVRRPAWSLAVLVLAGACVMVKPWEREQLATKVMTRSNDVAEAMCERTFFESREGATGGYTTGPGGGCACN